MKFNAVFLLSAILALLSVSVSGLTLKPVCYRETQKCCFLFRRCGYIVKKVPAERSCPFKVCKKVCKRVCHPRCTRVRVSVPYEKCHYKPVRVCRRVRRDWGWVKECKYERKRHCRTYYRTVWKPSCRRVCERKCRRHCYRVKAICRFDRIFHHPKYCPYLKCSRPVFDGHRGRPGHIVSPNGKFVRATKTVRTDISRRPKW